MKFILLLLFFIAHELKANPFLPVLEQTASPGALYYKQTPPFEYPFTQSPELNSLEVNVDKLSSLLGEPKVNQYAELFKSFKYDQKLNLYAYDFAVGENWEFLPHPIVKDVSAIHPNEWVEEFSRKLNENDGINSLEFIKSINELTDSEVYAGNNLEVLKTPHNFNTIKNRLASARNHVFMSSFIFQCDSGSQDILKLMEKKIQEGVSIYLLIDKVFTLADRSCVRRLKEIGVHLGLIGGPLKIFHEKMYVFDGEYAVIDGQNMAAIQTLSNGSNNLINDMGLGIQGSLVEVVAQRFITHWRKFKKRPMPQSIIELYGRKRAENLIFKSKAAIKNGLNNKTGVCRLVTSDPGLKDRKILPMYLAYAKAAQNYLFFNQIDHRFQDVSGNSLGKRFLKEIISVANKNKKLRIDMLTNQWKLPTEIKLPEGAGVRPTLFSFLVSNPGKLIIEMPHLQIGTARKNIIPLLDGANLNWWASGIYMHAKTMMVDNLATMIGSYNINASSENISYEQVVVCHDEKLSQEMQKSIVQDLLNSIPIPLAE